MSVVSTVGQQPGYLRFCATFNPGVKALGVRLFERGLVEEAYFEEVNEMFAAIVQFPGKGIFEVSIDPAPGVQWTSMCTCGNRRCEHVYATLMILEAFQMPQLTVEDELFDPSLSVSVKKPTIQVSKSPLMDAVANVLGKKLSGYTRDYIRRIQQLYTDAVNQNHRLMGYQLSMLDPHLRYDNWSAVELWPSPPANDLEFWLYCAWEIRKHSLAIPEELVAITDLDSIAPRMYELERKKEVQRWTAALHREENRVSFHTEKKASVRVVLGPDHAFLEFRASKEEPFKPLKTSTVNRIESTHASFAIDWEGAAGTIWDAINQGAERDERFKLEYSSQRANGILRRLILAEALRPYVVNHNRDPLVLMPHPLRYDLRPALADSEDYVLRMVRSDGTAPGEILAFLFGSPFLYLTPEGVYEGPEHHLYGPNVDLTIPAPALETSGGVGFMMRLGLELPPRLAALTRVSRRNIRIECELLPTHPGSQKEDLVLRVIAEEPGELSDSYTPQGWVAREETGTKKVRSFPNSKISVVERPGQQHFPALLEQLNSRWENYLAHHRVKVNKDFPVTFSEWLRAVPSEIEVRLEGELASFRDAPMAASVRLDVDEVGVDWFDLKVALDISDHELTTEELNLLLNAKGGYVRLGKKGWRRLEYKLDDDDNKQLARLGLDARDFTAEPQRLHALQLADDQAARWLPPQQVEKIHRRASELKARVAPPVPEGIKAELRPYQVEGFHFLAYLTSNSFGGVLADDMGLGKTVQTLTWLAWLRAEASAPLRPSVVICPKSVMENWGSEAEKFLPGLRVKRWEGENAAALTEAREKFDLIVLNYQQMRSLSPEITSMRWHAAILDEAQYIKNPDSQTAQIARSLQADQRLALTGTPIENRLLDLWSILAFAMPGVLGNRTQFTRRFNATDDPLARRRLSARVRPFLLRRTKGQVAQDLPDRIEEDLVCELEGVQKTLYRAELKRARQMLLKVKTKQELNDNRFNILTSLLRLRQICCHPALVDATLHKAESAKVNALMDLLEPLVEEGNKVLVFSQFVTMLDLLKEAVTERSWRHFYLAGDTENRGDLVKNFQSSEGAGVFLISLKAGGFGLNLTAASYVVLFDPWWNPAVESQAIDRTHRIGQVNKVIAYRLLIKDTIEEKIRHLQKGKAALADAVLGEETFAKGLTLEDLQFLLSSPDAIEM